MKIYWKSQKYNPDAIGISVNSIDAQRVYQLVLLIKALGKPLISVLMLVRFPKNYLKKVSI